MLFLLGPIRVLSGKITIPWSGGWIADLVLDPEVPADPPGEAKLPLVLGENAPFFGTVDGDRTGSFGGVHKARLVGGKGWRRELPPQHFRVPVQVLSPAVITPTAAAALEVATVLVPTPMGEDGSYVRHAGPASRVLEGMDWHVSRAGVTIVGPRVPVPLNPLDVELLHYDPATRTVELGGTTVVEPGSIILPDPLRGLTETLTVRHVEITFGAAGFRTVARCGDAPDEPGPPLVVMLRRLMREVAKREFSRLTRYRVVGPGPEGSWLLQAVELGEKADLIGAKLWPGIQGASAELLPSSIVLVGWGPGQDPVIVASDDSTPLALSFDAMTLITLGAAALPVVKGPPLATAIAAAATAANGIVGPVTGPALSGILTTLANAITGASTTKVLAE